jgi:hypothetical protein
VASADTTVHYAGTPVSAGQTLFWRVRVFSAGAWSSWSSSSWHMNAAPAAPVLYAPVANAVATQNGPVLTTSNASDPENDVCTYSYEVYQDSALTTLAASTSGVAQGSPRTSWTVNVLLTEHGRYFWRARANDSYFSGPWSTAAPFYVDAVNQAPTAPHPDSPADSAVLLSTTLSVSWSGATDPDLVDTLRYRVQVDTQASFATAVVYGPVSTQSINVPGVLSFFKRYYWRVTVFDKGGLNATSVARTFLNLLAGDTNGDGSITAADIVVMVNYIFKGGAAPSPVAVADVNASCTVTSADVIYLVNYVFKSGPAPLVGCASL